MDAELLRDKLSLDVDTADWNLLAPHFARGVLVLCEPPLDLLDAAVAVARDDAAAVSGWLDSGALRQATDADGHAFSAVPTTFRFVIVAPFVLAVATPLAEA